MDIYQKDLTDQAAEFAVKKYCSHYQVPDSILQSIDINNQFYLNKLQAKKKEKSQ